MIDLPVPSASSASAPPARTGANLSARGAAAQDPTVQKDEQPFQAVLAQELGLAPNVRALQGGHLSPAALIPDRSLQSSDEAAQSGTAGDAPTSPILRALHGQRVAAAAAAKTDRGLSSADDDAQTAAVDDAPLSPMPFPLQLQGTPAAAAARTDRSPKADDAAAQTVTVNDAPLLPASAGVNPFGLTGLPAPPGIPGASPVPAGYTPASNGRTGFALERQTRPARESAAADTESRLPATPAAVDSALPGKFPSSGADESRRDAAFDTRLLEQHKTAPAPSAAGHAGSAEPVQFTPTPAAALEARVGERGWDQGLGDKLVWMAGQKHQMAELHLNPPDLGPLKITLTLDHDQASAQFVSAHASVREAIEMAMPRLREILAESGINLGNTNVSADAFREQAQPQHAPRAYPAAPVAAAADAGSVTRGERLLRRSHGLVDTFA